MPSYAEFVAAGTILVGLVFYALSGGADFGGGVWDLLAGGPRARNLLRRACRAYCGLWLRHLGPRPACSRSASPALMTACSSKATF
jgi:hypothetical protein